MLGSLEVKTEWVVTITCDEEDEEILVKAATEAGYLPTQVAEWMLNVLVTEAKRAVGHI